MMPVIIMVSILEAKGGLNSLFSTLKYLKSQYAIPIA